MRILGKNLWLLHRQGIPGCNAYSTYSKARTAKRRYEKITTKTAVIERVKTEEVMKNPSILVY